MKCKLKLTCVLLWSVCGASAAAAQPAEGERFIVLDSGLQVGHVTATHDAHGIAIEHSYRINGRGPDLRESLELDADGVPALWQIEGTEAFGNKVAEVFRRRGNRATWNTGKRTEAATLEAPRMYIAQAASPFALGIYVRALLKQPGMAIAGLPAGRLRLEKLRDTKLGNVQASAYRLSGASELPQLVLLDSAGRLLAVSDRLIREDVSAAIPELTQLAHGDEHERFAGLQQKLAHRYDGPVRVRNVRVFDPASGALGEPVSVIFFNGRISGVQSLSRPDEPGDTVIDGEGGSLVPGLHDTHFHFTLLNGLMSVAAGVTTARDMGSDNAKLADYRTKVEAGELAGPRILPSGLLEGQSPFALQGGVVATNEAEALAAVRWYAERGYIQTKIYNSVRPEWAPAIIRESHALGMRVAGHIPAFSTPDDMIAAGYDELTHINQLLLGWVLKPGEDSSTPLRLVAMARAATLDLNSVPVRKTVDAISAKRLAVEPTLAIMEVLMLSRAGQVMPGYAAYFKHMPPIFQQNRMTDIMPIANAKDDAAYRAAFAKMLETVRVLHARGVQLLPGTDEDHGFLLHRELELFTQAGMTPAQAIDAATLRAARYLGHDQDWGSIVRGKSADFILVSGDPTQDIRALQKVRMTVARGTVYFPAQIYEALDIEPFTTSPSVATKE